MCNSKPLTSITHYVDLSGDTVGVISLSAAIHGKDVLHLYPEDVDEDPDVFWETLRDGRYEVVMYPGTDTSVWANIVLSIWQGGKDYTVDIFVNEVLINHGNYFCGFNWTFDKKLPEWVQ